MGLGSKAAHEATGATRLKPVADEAGRGYIPVALAEALVPRMHLTKRLLSLHRAQPAPPLHTRRVLPADAETRRGRWLREGSRAGVVASGGVGGTV